MFALQIAMLQNWVEQTAMEDSAALQNSCWKHSASDAIYPQNNTYSGHATESTE